MQTRRLGADGPLISAIGIGAMSFSDFYGATDETQSHAILETALDEGVPISIPRMSMAPTNRKPRSAASC